MGLACGFFKSTNGSNVKHLHGGRKAVNSDTVLVIQIPGAQVLRILSRAMFMATVLVTLLFLGYNLEEGYSSSSHPSVVSGIDSVPVSGIDSAPTSSVNAQILNFLLRDLANEGLLRKGDKALIVKPSNGFTGVITFRKNDFDEVLDSDLERQTSISDESYDFVFTSNSVDLKFVDRILKSDGIVALPLDSDPSIAFKEQSNYRVVYLRRYSSMIVALRKNVVNNKMVGSSTRRKLFQLGSEAKKVALNGLEDVLLEPPEYALAKSKKYLKKIKYLPDLTGDSLEGYKRRVFIGVGSPEENRGAIEWFQKNYPKKKKKFAIHSIQGEPHKDVSTWLLKHVKEEEFVVMKAEAETVEMMIKKRAILLVDELFLECNNEWWHSGKRRNGRAYWECLALYGRLRDEGVAVHQWWG